MKPSPPTAPPGPGSSTPTPWSRPLPNATPRTAPGTCGALRRRPPGPCRAPRQGGRPATTDPAERRIPSAGSTAARRRTSRTGHYHPGRRCSCSTPGWYLGGKVPALPPGQVARACRFCAAPGSRPTRFLRLNRAPTGTGPTASARSLAAPSLCPRGLPLVFCLFVDGSTSIGGACRTAILEDQPEEAKPINVEYHRITHHPSPITDLDAVRIVSSQACAGSCHHRRCQPVRSGLEEL